MPVAELQAWLEAWSMPRPNQALPDCPYCGAETEHLDIRGPVWCRPGDEDRPDEVLVKPCGHQVIATYTLGQP